MRIPRFRIRTLMAAVAVAGVGSWVAVRHSLINYRHAIIVTAGVIGFAAILALLVAWAWVAYRMTVGSRSS